MISDKDIKKLSELSRISVSPDEMASMPGEISSILDYISQINKAISKDEITPSYNLVNVLRADENPHESKIHTEEILKEAPQRQGDYLKVKKIL